jgi:uncharacterized protein DUF1236
MRTNLLTIAAIAGALDAPLAAQAQDVIGVVGSGPVIVNRDIGIAVNRWPAFREYIVREHVPNYVIPGGVYVGAALPPNIVYYQIPETFGVVPYRYTVVNDEPVLIDPYSRRVVEVLD